MPRGELSGNSSRARRSLGEQTRSALAARLNRRGKKSESRRFAASGLKPSLILHDLRGAKAPLYHSAAGFRDFFRSLKSRALSRTFYESFTKFSVNLLLMIRAQQMPGLAIVFEARTFASALRIEAKAFAGREGLDGEHVADIERDDVGDKNVNVVGGVNHLALPVDGVD